MKNVNWINFLNKHDKLLIRKSDPCIWSSLVPSFFSFFSEQNGCPLLQKGNRAVCVPQVVHFLNSNLRGLGGISNKRLEPRLSERYHWFILNEVQRGQKRIFSVRWTDSLRREPTDLRLLKEKRTCRLFEVFRNFLIFFEICYFSKLKSKILAEYLLPQISKLLFKEIIFEKQLFPAEKFKKIKFWKNIYINQFFER